MKRGRSIIDMTIFAFLILYKGFLSDLKTFYTKLSLLFVFFDIYAILHKAPSISGLTDFITSFKNVQNPPFTYIIVVLC